MTACPTYFAEKRFKIEADVEALKTEFKRCFGVEPKQVRIGPEMAYVYGYELYSDGEHCCGLVVQNCAVKYGPIEVGIWIA